MRLICSEFIFVKGFVENRQSATFTVFGEAFLKKVEVCVASVTLLYLQTHPLPSLLAKRSDPPLPSLRGNP